MNFSRHLEIRIKKVNPFYAVSMQAPPIALILSSADFENSLAFTIIGIFGSSPFPSTLKKPYESLITQKNTAFVQSITTAFALSASFAILSLAFV